MNFKTCHDKRFDPWHLVWFAGSYMLCDILILFMPPWIAFFSACSFAMLKELLDGCIGRYSWAQSLGFDKRGFSQFDLYFACSGAWYTLITFTLQGVM